MPNHPNRGANSPSRNPAPDEIRAWRRERELSASAAAALVHSVGRVWQQWEAGERRMHPAFWELARLKYGRRPTNGRLRIRATLVVLGLSTPRHPEWK